MRFGKQNDGFDCLLQTISGKLCTFGLHLLSSYAKVRHEKSHPAVHTVTTLKPPSPGQSRWGPPNNCCSLWCCASTRSTAESTTLCSRSRTKGSCTRIPTRTPPKTGELSKNIEQVRSEGPWHKDLCRIFLCYFTIGKRTFLCSQLEVFKSSMQ